MLDELASLLHQLPRKCKNSIIENHRGSQPMLSLFLFVIHAFNEYQKQQKQCNMVKGNMKKIPGGN